MKFIFFAPLLTVLSITANSQISQRTWLVGGSGSFYSYTEDYSTPTYNQTAKATNIDITASFGYFLIDKFAVGVKPYLSTTKSVVTSTSVGSGGENHGFQIAVGPFVRYYFLNSEKPYNIIADISYQIGTNKFKGTPTAKGKFNTFSLMTGTEIFFNQIAGLEILLGYRQRITSIENATSAFNSNKSGFQISIGFTIHLEKL